MRLEGAAALRQDGERVGQRLAAADPLQRQGHVAQRSSLAHQQRLLAQVEAPAVGAVAGELDLLGAPGLAAVAHKAADAGRTLDGAGSVGRGGGGQGQAQRRQAQARGESGAEQLTSGDLVHRRSIIGPGIRLDQLLPEP